MFRSVCNQAVLTALSSIPVCLCLNSSCSWDDHVLSLSPSVPELSRGWAVNAAYSCGWCRAVACGARRSPSLPWITRTAAWNRSLKRSSALRRPWRSSTLMPTRLRSCPKYEYNPAIKTHMHHIYKNCWFFTLSVSPVLDVYQSAIHPTSKTSSQSLLYSQFGNITYCTYGGLKLRYCQTHGPYK